MLYFHFPVHYMYYENAVFLKFHPYITVAVHQADVCRLQTSPAVLTPAGLCVTHYNPISIVIFIRGNGNESVGRVVAHRL